MPCTGISKKKAPPNTDNKFNRFSIDTYFANFFLKAMDVDECCAGQRMLQFALLSHFLPRLAEHKRTLSPGRRQEMY